MILLFLNHLTTSTLSSKSPSPSSPTVTPSLNYSSYYWRTVTIVCLRLGERMGRTTVAHSLLSTVFYPYILILMTYLLLPIHLTFIHIKHNQVSHSSHLIIDLSLQNSLPVADRRLLIMFYSFLMGSFSSHLLIQWIPNTNLPHPFFIPAIVGVMIQVFFLFSNRLP